MSKSLTARVLLRIGRSITVRPVRVAAVVVLSVALCVAVSLLTDWSDRAVITLALKTISPSSPAGGGSEASASVVLPVYRDLVRSDTVLSRTLAVISTPDSPAVSTWRQAREAWETGRSPEDWAALEQALQQLDAETDRLGRDETTGRVMLAALARLSDRVGVAESGSQASLGLLKVSVSWPVKCGDVRRVADGLAKMACDRIQEVQMKASHDASDFIRLRRESLRPSQLAPAEDAFRQFVEHELESPADLAHLDQLNRSPAEADLPVSIKRMRLELLTLDSQQADARRLRRLLLEALPLSLWNGSPRRNDAGEPIAPDITRVGEERLPEGDPVLEDLTIVIPKDALDRNVVLSRLKAREAELLVELNRLRSEFNPGYLGIGDKRGELVRTRREILTQVIGEAAQLQVSIATLSARREELDRRLEANERQFQRLTAKLSRYQQVVNDLDAARKRYLGAWLDETEAMKNQEQGLPAAVLQVLDVSGDYAGRHAWMANPWKAAVCGAVSGALLAIAYALLVSVLDRTLRWPDEVQRYVGVPVVARIPKVGDRIVA
jgi:hypothetical protein